MHHVNMGERVLGLDPANEVLCMGSVNGAVMHGWTTPMGDSVIGVCQWECVCILYRQELYCFLVSMCLLIAH